MDTAVGPFLTISNAKITFRINKNPMGIIAAGEGFPIAILNRNKPAFYCIPAHTFEVMMEKIEDYELNVMADSRKDQPEIFHIF